MKHIGTKIIETKRLILRPFKKEDGEPMFHNWASDPEVTRFLTWPAHENPGISRMVVESWIEENKNPENYQWAIEWKAIGEPIGSISAVKTDAGTQSATIGYCIGRSWWGQGIMTEALQAVIIFFFKEVGMNSVNACHDPRNPNSGRVMRKCGMTYEGTWREGGVNNQGICDECWYSILKKEYEALARPKWSVKQLTDPLEKTSVAREILETLTEWFGIAEAREAYIGESTQQLFFAAFCAERPIGFLCLKKTGKETAELAVMGVLKEYHRQGVGRELFQAAKKCAARKGYSFLQVKTVQMGCYEEYDKTNRFYQSLGFGELEVFPTLWGEKNPCQIYVMKTEG